MSLQSEAIQRQAESLVAETERWCWKALAQGTGMRVWRSEPGQMPFPNYGLTYKFAILEPGQSPPGSGTIFGPFSKAVL